MKIVNDMLKNIEIPKFATISQNFETNKIENISSVINGQFCRDIYKNRIKQGDKIGITVGSRGIANLKEIVRDVCNNIKNLGADPVLIPSMGSHGGATAEGQRHVLEELGVTEEYTGAIIRSSMEVVKLGICDMGFPVYYDKIANELDGVIVLNRVKAHTDLDGDIESGLHKITAIGLGNHMGAVAAHEKGLDNALKRIISSGRYALNNSNIIFGIAILENAFDETSDIEFIPVEDIADREPILLAKSKKQLPRFLFNDIDILIVDYIGKNISGGGMDPNIIGRSMIGSKNKDIKIKYIVSLNLTPETMGSAIGIGLCDVTTRKIYDSLEFESTYANAITAIAINGAKIPVVMDNDKKAIQLAIKVCCANDNRKLRIARIRDTLSMKNIMVSESIVMEIKDNSHPDIKIKSELKNLEFNYHNNLIDIIMQH